MKLNGKIKTVFLLCLLAVLGGCAAYAQKIAEKNNSWIGSHWKEYNQRSSRGECYPAGDGVVSCYLQDWTVDANGIITGWRPNSRR